MVNVSAEIKIRIRVRIGMRSTVRILNRMKSIPGVRARIYLWV